MVLSPRSSVRGYLSAGCTEPAACSLAVPRSALLCGPAKRIFSCAALETRAGPAWDMLILHRRFCWWVRTNIASVCKARLWFSRADHRPFWSLSQQRPFHRGTGHSDEIGFALHMSPTSGRRAAQEIFRGSLGIRKKKTVYTHCASLIFLLFAEASCKLRG